MNYISAINRHNIAQLKSHPHQNNLRLSPNAMFQITSEGGGFYEVGGDNTIQEHILFALPIAVGILGVLEFVLIGFLLLTYYARHKQVNTMR